MAQFQRAHPLVEVQIDEVVDEVAVHWLLQRRVELGFVVLPDERFDTLPVVTDELVAVLPVSHPLASKKTVSAKDFHNQPFIRTSAGSCRHIDQFLEAQGVIPKTLFRFEQLTSMMGFVAQVDAIAIAARLALPDAPAGLAYRSLQPRWPREIALAALNFERLSPAARAFIEIASMQRKKFGLDLSILARCAVWRSGTPIDCPPCAAERAQTVAG